MSRGDAGTSGHNGPADGGPPVRRLGDWDADRLRDLAAEYDTPLYVLDLDRVRENYRRLAAAFPGAEICYAAKANALRDVLETLLDAGASIECASAGEVHRALAAGAPGDRIHYTAVNPPAGDLDYAVETWRTQPELTVTVGAADTIDRLEERGYDGRLCLRVNPGIGAGHHEKVRTGADAKFGVPVDRAVDVLVDAAERGFDVVGVHAHVGSGLSSDDLDAHREFVSTMADLATDVNEALAASEGGATAGEAEGADDGDGQTGGPDDGRTGGTGDGRLAGTGGGRTAGPLEFVDVGGGFGVPYREDEAPLDLEAVAETTREAFADVNARLTIEPGRYLVADAGVLLSRVNTVKDASGTTVVGLDAGMTTLLRPAMYDAYHPVRSLAPDAADRESIPQTLTGPICESSDVLCTDRRLPRLARGEYVSIGNAGAYGYEMASTYNSRPRPASVVLRDGEPALARRRETIADVTRLETAGEGGSRTDHNEPEVIR